MQKPKSIIGESIQKVISFFSSKEEKEKELRKKNFYKKLNEKPCPLCKCGLDGLYSEIGQRQEFYCVLNRDHFKKIYFNNKEMYDIINLYNNKGHYSLAKIYNFEYYSLYHDSSLFYYSSSDDFKIKVIKYPNIDTSNISYENLTEEKLLEEIKTMIIFS